MARITLYHEPTLPSGAPRRVEIAVTRADGKAITAAYARDFAHRAQARYDETRVPPSRTGAALDAPSPDALTVSKWVDDWLVSQTYTEAPKDLMRVRAWLPRTSLARLPLREVTPKVIAVWLRELRKLPNARGRKAAPRTLRNVVDLVARALRYAVFEEHLTQDPFAVIPGELRPQSVDADPTRRRGRRFTLADLVRLIACAEAPDDRRVLYTLFVLSGARLGEAVGLRWCDITPEAPLARLTIAEQWHQRLRMRMPTKTDAVREVPVHPELARVLAWWRTRWADWYGQAPTDQDLIVPARRTRMMPSLGGSRRQASVWLGLHTDLKRAALVAHRTHDLRHTFVSLCADAGMAAEVAQRWTHTTRTSGSAVDLYRAPSWQRQCEEMLKLRVEFAVGRDEPYSLE
jgi:integrase